MDVGMLNMIMFYMVTMVTMLILSVKGDSACSESFKGPQIVADPDDCAGFYICHSGLSFRFTCDSSKHGPRKVFDPQTGNCVLKGSSHDHSKCKYTRTFHINANYQSYIRIHFKTCRSGSNIGFINRKQKYAFERSNTSYWVKTAWTHNKSRLYNNLSNVLCHEYSKFCMFKLRCSKLTFFSKIHFSFVKLKVMPIKIKYF